MALESILDHRPRESRLRPSGGVRRLLAVALRQVSRRRPCCWEPIRVFGPPAVWARRYPAHRRSLACESGCSGDPGPARLSHSGSDCEFASSEMRARPSRGRWSRIASSHLPRCGPVWDRRDDWGGRYSDRPQQEPRSDRRRKDRRRKESSTYLIELPV